MTAAVLRSSPNLAVPHTQNTAPVHEFNCLYTHDLRRKQKRWHDGFLRYHTFNKRVMVYDVPRNFLGDLHWTSGDDLQEGDEMTLEKGGIIVQVAERTGIAQTDLTDLLQRKDRTPAKNPASSRPMLRHATPHVVTSSSVPRTPYGASQTPMKHKSLNALLGRSRRPIGKASLPTESPFEIRNRELRDAENDRERQSKRQKLDSPVKTPKPAQNRRNKVAQKSSNPPALSEKACDVIDISSDTEDAHPSHPTNRAIEAELLATSSPAFESPAQVQRRHVNPLPSERQQVPTNHVVESPSARGSNKVGHVAPSAPEAARVVTDASSSRAAGKPRDDKRPVDKPPVQSSETFAAESDSQRRGKSLKLVGGAPRKMLLFQPQNSRPPSSDAETRGMTRDRSGITREKPSTSPPKEVQQLVHFQQGTNDTPDKESEESTFHRRVQERLARIDREKRAGLQRSSSDTTEQRPSNERAESGAGLKKTSSVIMVQPESLELPEDPALLDFPFSDVTQFDGQDFITEPPIAQPVLRRGPPLKPMSGGPSAITARSFKPLTVKAGPSDALKAAAAKAIEEKRARERARMAAERRNEEMAKVAEEARKNEDLGPWSKEAFDLMDWRPPNMQPKPDKVA